MDNWSDPIPFPSFTDSKTPILVIGHRNPDTDAICSAIGYAALLRANGYLGAEPARCGDVTARTNWVLRKAGIEQPQLVTDVRPTIRDIARRQIVTAQRGDTLWTVNGLMLENQVRSLPVMDDGRLVGMPTLAEMAQLLMPSARKNNHQHRGVHTSLANIVEVLDAKTIVKSPDTGAFTDLVIVIAGSSLSATRRRVLELDTSRVIVLVGDRPEIHRVAVAAGVRAVIVTGGHKFGSKLVVAARKGGTAVLSSQHDTATTTQLIRFSQPVGRALHTDYLTFAPHELVKDVLGIVSGSHQPLFPVLDPTTAMLEGVFSKSDLLKVPVSRLVLVDHNEFSQAVKGADEAEILEIIDHHRLSGNLRTKLPIRYINEPIGSTCSIVARLYRMNGMRPDKGIALCICAGLISDTLNLTSPTTTSIDRDLLGWLAGIARIKVDAFVHAFFAAGSLLRECEAAVVLESDRKEFDENGWRISISQIEELGLKEFASREHALHQALDEVVMRNCLHFACLMVTDIGTNNSILLTAGDQRVVGSIDHPCLRPRVFEMLGVVSRKKQLFPYLSERLATMTAP